MATAKKKLKKAVKKKKPTKRRSISPMGQSEINIKTVKYHCAGGNCSAVPPSRHMKPGDLVMLFATDTGATITFTAGSPFVSGAIQIVLVQGAVQLEVVGDFPGRTFPYNLTCTNPLCAILSNPPEMIVDFT